MKFKIDTSLCEKSILSQMQMANSCLDKQEYGDAEKLLSALPSKFPIVRLALLGAQTEGFALIKVEKIAANAEQSPEVCFDAAHMVKYLEIAPKILADLPDPGTSPVGDYCRRILEQAKAEAIDSLLSGFTDALYNTLFTFGTIMFDDLDDFYKLRHFYQFAGEQNAAALNALRTDDVRIELCARVYEILCVSNTHKMKHSTHFKYPIKLATDDFPAPQNEAEERFCIVAGVFIEKFRLCQADLASLAKNPGEKEKLYAALARARREKEIESVVYHDKLNYQNYFGDMYDDIRDVIRTWRERNEESKVVVDAMQKGLLRGRYEKYFSKFFGKDARYAPSSTNEVLNKSTVSPEIAARMIRAFEQKPDKYEAFRKEMEQAYQHWENWYLSSGNKKLRQENVDRVAHNDENWQREVNAVIPTQIFLNDAYAELRLFWKYDSGKENEALDTAYRAMHALSKNAIPGFPDTFNPAPSDKPCLNEDRTSINKYFKILYKRLHHLTRKDYKTMEALMYYAVQLEQHAIRASMYESAAEITLVDALRSEKNR